MEPHPSRPVPLLDRAAVRRAFGRAATTYDAAAVLHREIGSRMAARLAYIRLDPARLLDAGCGTGGAIAALRGRYPRANIVALDFALPMVAEVRRLHAPPQSWLRNLVGTADARGAASVQPLCADMAALPLAPGSVDLVWSNLALQWCNDPPAVLGEFLRVLRVGGLLMFSSLGPDTLRELRAAFATVDRYPHVSAFVDLHDLGDQLVEAGFADPVMDMEAIELIYRDSGTLFRDLRATGAHNAATTRARGLMGRRRWRRILEALGNAPGSVSGRAQSGGLSVTWEVVYGHAWKAQPRVTAEGHPIVRMQPRRAAGGRT